MSKNENARESEGTAKPSFAGFGVLLLFTTIGAFVSVAINGGKADSLPLSLGCGIGGAVGIAIGQAVGLWPKKKSDK